MVYVIRGDLHSRTSEIGNYRLVWVGIAWESRDMTNVGELIVISTSVRENHLPLAAVDIG